jgi:hypothetical protein
MTLALPTICTMLVAPAFLPLERLAPGRELPHAPGWYARAVLINVVQAAITFGTNGLSTTASTRRGQSAQIGGKQLPGSAHGVHDHRGGGRRHINHPRS